MDMRRVCVFCGSRPGTRPRYVEHARELGTLLAQSRLGLVYGGASVGSMGALADAAIAAGGEVIGIIPEALVAREIAHPALGRLEVVRTMHDRKARMAALADAFIALPGGFGTLEELFEVVTWAMLGIHRKPIGLLDTEGFFAPLLAFVFRAVDEGFVSAAHASMIVVRDEPRALLSAIVSAEGTRDTPRVMRMDES